MEAIDDLIVEISATPEGPEREELERTLAACREIIYAVAEGFLEVDTTEGEDNEPDYRLFPHAECYHAEPIGA